MFTPRQIIKGNIKRRLEVFDHKDDQLFVKTLKMILGLRLWFCIHDLFVFILLKNRKIIDKPFGTESEAKSKVHQAIDWYNLFWLCILIFSYIVFVFTYRKWDHVPILILFLLILLSGYRILDIFAGIASLHLRIPYETSNPIRAVVLAIVDYFQIVLTFSILYLCFGILVKDCFNGQTIHEFYSGFMNAVYFSSVTIATLGYGDFSPQTWLCKLTTIAEVFCGIIIIVVILQRVISLTQKGCHTQEDSKP